MAEAATFATPPFARRALVPAARALVAVNEVMFAVAAWLLLPVDVTTPTATHLALAAWFFLLISAFATVFFGGWKAMSLALRWRSEGSLLWAWGWLASYAAYGVFCAFSVARLA